MTDIDSRMLTNIGGGNVNGRELLNKESRGGNTCVFGAQKTEKGTTGWQGSLIGGTLGNIKGNLENIISCIIMGLPLYSTKKWKEYNKGCAPFVKVYRKGDSRLTIATKQELSGAFFVLDVIRNSAGMNFTRYQ